jgi:hypothetical protein
MPGQIRGRPPGTFPPGRGLATVLPVTTARYRCTACGNLTRFDVVSWRRTQSFHHYTVGGELVVEEERVLGEDVEQVHCRWCGNGSSVEEIDAASAETSG